MCRQLARAPVLEVERRALVSELLPRQRVVAEITGGVLGERRVRRIQRIPGLSLMS